MANVRNTVNQWIARTSEIPFEKQAPFLIWLSMLSILSSGYACWILLEKPIHVPLIIGENPNSLGHLLWRARMNKKLHKE